MPQNSKLHPQQGRLAAAIAAACAALFQGPAIADNPAEVLELPTLEVIGTTPLPGIGTAERDVPANVQVFGAKELAKQRQSNVVDYLEQNPTSITINSTQGNPYQPDVSFRGFTASPLLGLPQGMSVFQDGVRINEPFGDTVNWDFIPQSAISSIQLVPGSNPAFGLNTLGGALAVYTKSGTQNPGGAVEVSGGSFGRQTLSFEQGGQFQQNWDYFVTGNYFDDQGWADHNASRVKQFFGKVGHQTETSDVDVSLTLADNTLQGTQTIPRSFSDNIKQAYTFPDLNLNKLTFLTIKGSQFLDKDLLLGGNAYYRKYRNTNVSSNVNGNFDPTDPNSAQATNDQSLIDQTSYGLGAQLTLSRKLAGHDNQFTVGVTGDFGRTEFTQNEQTAQFTATRDTVGTSPYGLITDAKTSNNYYGIYLTDTFSMTKQWTLTVSGRYNRAEVKIEDQTGAAPLLDGDHTFSRFNPAVGLNYNPTDRLTAYASYSEGMRAPTPVELTCADPNAPCKLPNNFLADPDLKKVVAKTAELGTRGKWGEDSGWSAAVYRTELYDDIQFISSSVTGSANTGYFQNVGETRRQGIELAAHTRFGAWGISARYAFLDATYRTAFSENSPSNSTADANGAIQVRPGDRIPGLPQHSIKLRLDYDNGGKFSGGVNVVYSSDIYARGDENNQDVNGKISGYSVVNLDARYKIQKNLEAFARVNNLFDRTYANFGILGSNFFTGPGRTFDGNNTVNEQFLGYGAPRGIWVGLRYSWL